MARKELHGLRHGQRLTHGDACFTVDTKSDDDWVLLLRHGAPVIRVSKVSSGMYYRTGMAHDPGRPGYPIHALRAGAGTWSEYSGTAEAGYIGFNLDRFV